MSHLVDSDVGIGIVGDTAQAQACGGQARGGQAGGQGVGVHMAQPWQPVQHPLTLAHRAAVGPEDPQEQKPCLRVRYHACTGTRVSGWA